MQTPPGFSARKALATAACSSTEWCSAAKKRTTSYCPSKLERFRCWRSGVAAVGEEVGALLGAERVGAGQQELPQAGDRPLPGLAQQRLELAEGVLDRAEVRAVCRQQPQLAAGPLDRL